MQDAKNLAWKDSRVGWVMALVIGAILVLAYFDGGEEPLRPMQRDLPLPGGAG